MTDPPQTPAERFAALLHGMIQVVAARTGWSLTLLLIAQIGRRIQGIRQRFVDLAARIGDGTYSPRRGAAPPRKRPGQAPQQNPLPHKFGWLLALVPETVGARWHFELLLRDPEMAALLATAPAALRRPLRSLCWMLGLVPPPVLALPPRPRPPRPRPPRPPAAPETPSPSDYRPRTKLGFYKGPPPMLPSMFPRAGRPRKISG
jgi:hypothetical protein